MKTRRKDEDIEMNELPKPIPFVLLSLILAACDTYPVAAPSATGALEESNLAPTVQLTEPNSESELVEIDGEWNRYTNRRLGFSMRVPRQHYRFDADCYWNETETDSSYRPLGGVVPVVVIEGEDRVFITSEYYSELKLPTQIPSGNGYRTEFDGCARVENDLEHMLASEGTSFYWEIVVWDVAAEDDLEALVDAVYGECFRVGEKTPGEGNEFIRVQVQGDGKPIEESTCLLNGGYVFFYAPDLGKAATWLTGQSYHFPADAEYSKAYDSQMVESFQFIEE